MVVVASIFLIFSSTLIIFAFEYSNPQTIGHFSFFDKILSSYFIAINYRTAGFNTLDMGHLHDASLFLDHCLWLLVVHQVEQLGV